jgi:hypothetical protein
MKKTKALYNRISDGLKLLSFKTDDHKRVYHELHREEDKRHHDMASHKSSFNHWLNSLLIAFLCLALLPSDAYAQCANPAGNEGEIIFNTDFDVMQYCDDTNWIAMGKGSSLEEGLIGHWKLDDYRPLEAG